MSFLLRTFKPALNAVARTVFICICFSKVWILGSALAAGNEVYLVCVGFSFFSLISR